MSDIVAAPPVDPNPYARGDERWLNAEAGRLQDMDAFFEPFTHEDLGPVIAMQKGEHPEGVSLLDIAAATSTTTEAMCDEAGVTYYALDIDPGMLAQRKTPPGRTIISPSQAMDTVGSETFDVTYSRAATGWSSAPRDSIAEQLRVTRDGGVAVFSEFDWSTAGADIRTQAGKAVSGAKAILQIALVEQGFRPEYGKLQLAKDIDAVAAAQRLAYVREETVHVMPVADYRAFMLNMTGQLLEGLSLFEKGMAVTMRHDLAEYIGEIEAADELEFTLPNVVTQTIQIMGRTPDPFVD